MAGYFKIAAKSKLADMKVGDRLEESDFSTLTDQGEFVQFKYFEQEESTREKYKVKPGLWSITKTINGLVLQATSYVTDTILEEFVSTEKISGKIDSFFKKLHVYKDFGIDVPKRGLFLYGSAGSGKSTAINKVSRQYVTDGSTAVIIWPTDRYEAYDVKEFVKSFEYEGVTKLILVVEDIGGVEMDNVRAKSDSSLLSLLDNQEKTFTIPTYIIATTNFPEIFLGNLTNRPGRFDDKIEVGWPVADARAALLKFFSKGNATEDQMALIKHKDYEEFNPAHIKEAFIRAAIHDKSLEDALKEIKNEILLYKKAFTKPKKGMEMSSRFDD